MKYLMLCSFIAIAVAFSSCGKRMVKGQGTMTSEDRSIGTFTAIAISAPVEAHIHIQEGAKPSVQLKGYKNMLDEIQTDVEGTTLNINSPDFIHFATDKEVVADITVGSLAQLQIKGTADAHVDGELRGAEFKLKVSGAGDVTIEKLEVSRLTTTISGLGDVTIRSGSAGTIEYKVSGAGNINGYGMQGNDVKARVSGTGDIMLNAVRTLDAKVSGAGSIRYKGTPMVKSSTSGVGEIVAAN